MKNRKIPLHRRARGFVRDVLKLVWCKVTGKPRGFVVGRSVIGRGGAR